VIIETNVTM